MLNTFNPEKKKLVPKRAPFLLRLFKSYSFRRETLTCQSSDKHCSNSELCRLQPHANLGNRRAERKKEKKLDFPQSGPAVSPPSLPANSFYFFHRSNISLFLRSLFLQTPFDQDVRPRRVPPVQLEEAHQCPAEDADGSGALQCTGQSTPSAGAARPRTFAPRVLSGGILNQRIIKILILLL